MGFFPCCKCCVKGAEHLHQFPCPNHQTWKTKKIEGMDSDDLTSQNPA